MHNWIVLALKLSSLLESPPSPSASPRGIGAKRREPSSLRSIPSAKRKTKASSQSSAPVSALTSSQSSLPARNHGGCSWPVAWKSSRPCSARASFPFLSGTVQATGLSSVSLLPRSNTRCAFQAAAASLSHEAIFSLVPPQGTSSSGRVARLLFPITVPACCDRAVDGGVTGVLGKFSVVAGHTYVWAWYLGMHRAMQARDVACVAAPRSVLLRASEEPHLVL